MNKTLLILYLLSVLGKIADAQVADLPPERPLMYPLPDRALIKIVYFNEKQPSPQQNSLEDEKLAEMPRIKGQQITKFGETMVSRLEFSDGTTYETWQVDGRTYAPVANQDRYVAVSHGSISVDPFFPNPYGTFPWVGEKTFVGKEKTAQGDVWIFKAPLTKKPELGLGHIDSENRIEQPQIEVRVLAKTRFPITVKIGEISYGIQIVPGVPNYLVMPESLRKSVAEAAKDLAREISPLPPR